MKGFKAFPLVALSLFLCMLTACGSHPPVNGPSPLYVANKKVPDGVVQSSYNVTLVTQGGQGPFTWTLNSGNLPGGLTLSAAGVISGTPPVSDLDATGNAKTYSFGVKVTDSQTPTAAYNTANFSITINPLPQVTTTTLPNGTVGLAYSATLTNSGGLAPFTWTLTTGTLPTGLTLGATTGTISGTPTGATACGSFPITVQVTDADSNTASANLQITINQKLQGNNAFSFNGFDGVNPFYMAGSFVGDCAGNITGVLDQNGLATVDVATKAPFTGTYTPPPPPNPKAPPSSLGTLALNIPALGGTYNYSVAIPLNGDVRFILDDGNHPNVYGSGVIKAQSISGLTGLSSLQGNYAMGFFGVDNAGNRSAGAGAFVADGSGNLTSGIEDTNDNGTVSSQTAFTGTWTLDSDSSTTGRGTETLTVGANTLHYAFYVVNPKFELLAVQSDAVSSGASLSLVSVLGPIAAGTGGFSNASLNSPTVMELNGYTGGTSPLPDVQLGVATFDGMGGITLFQTDENSGGTHTTNSFTGGTYSVSTNGRVSPITGLGTGPQPVWYLTSSNRGFVIGTDPAVTQGTFEPQTRGPFSLPQFLTSYAGSTIAPVLTSVTNEVDSTFIPPPGGTIYYTYDTSGPGGPMVNLPFFPLMYVLDPNNGTTTGRLLLTPISPKLGPMEIAYLITASASGSSTQDNSNSKWASINITKADGTPDTNPRITVVQSTSK